MQKQKFILPIIATIFLFSIFPMVLGAWTSDLDNGLVSYWKFDEGSGTTAVNSIDTNLNGVLVNDANYQAGLIGSSVNISGGNNYVDIANNIPIQDWNNFTINFWMLCTENTGTFAPVSSHIQVTSVGSFGMDGTTSSTLYWYAGEASHSSPYPDNFDSGVWQMVTILRNDTSDCLYINGTFEDCEGQNGAITADGWYMGRQTAWFGAKRALLDEFGVWSNVTLNESQIAQLYNSGSGISYEAPPDITLPIITINSPTATTYDYLITEINFTATDNTALDTCWYSLDQGVTNTTATCNDLITSLTTADNSSYTWIMWANDTSGNEGTDFVTFSLDLPAIYITYPIATTYTSQVTELDYQYKDSPETCWYSLDGGVTNTTIVCGENVTSITSIEGSNTWEVWANNSIGEIFSDSITFNVELPVPPSSVENSPIYQVMNGAGAGLGIFMIFLGEALPVLLIGIIFALIIFAVGMGIAHVVKSGLKSSMNIGKGAGK